MYASQINQVQRMRFSGRNQATRGVSPTTKRQSLECGVMPPRMTGDYRFLKQNVAKERKKVQEARTALATSLDQLGEHHVRQKEYNDAMDAFAEALREKRSVFWQLHPNMQNSSGSDHRDAFSDSLINPEIESSSMDPSVGHDEAIDEIVVTLRSIGNVHSLRGEQDEAMRYYREITNLRAQKKVVGDLCSASKAKALSGMSDDNAAMMTEISEDVKALDDLFRSISFRGNEVSNKAETLQKEKRKSKPLIQAQNSASNSRNKRRRSDASAEESTTIENEPFTRSTSSLTASLKSQQIRDTESSDAIEIYKALIEYYTGERLGHHQEMLNSLALRVDLLIENLKKTMEQEDHDTISKHTDLELAIEIYNEVITLHEEKMTNQRRKADNDDGQRDFNDIEVQKAASNIASTLICMGSIYYKLGNRMEELRVYQEAKRVYLEAYGENHTFVAGTGKNIGMVLAERGEYIKAMNEFENAMKIYLNVNNGNKMSRDIASAMSCMGNVKNRMGELDAALSQYMEALKIYKFLHNESSSTKDPETMNISERVDTLRDLTSTLKVIGMVHSKKGDLDKAMRFFQEAMALLRSSESDSNNPIGRDTTASVLTRIASIHLKKGDLDQAMSNYKEAYDITVSNRGGTNHHEVASILHYIGGIYHKRTEYDEAMACYQEAIRIYHATLGAGNPTVAGTLVMVGSIYYKRRNLDSAMMFYREGLRLNRDAYGVHHPDVAPIMKSIATILTKKGDYQEAHKIFQDVLSIKCTVHGTDHPEVANAYKSLGNVYYKMGELADAERQYRHALNIYKRTKGDNDQETVAARTSIDHLRYWMKERGDRQVEQRHTVNSSRRESESERSC